MPLQTKVDLYRAPGVQGDKATPNQSIYFPKQLVAEGEVSVGSFVFYGTDASRQAIATKAGGTAADLVGFVERVINYVQWNVLESGTLKLPEGSQLTIAEGGDYWAVATTAATTGQKVFVNPATGAILTGTAGATVANSFETSWRVVQGAEVGSPFLMSNWPTVFNK